MAIIRGADRGVFRRSALLVLCGSGNHEAPAQFLLLSMGDWGRTKEVLHHVRL